MSESSVRGPLPEVNLANEEGLHPVRTACVLGRDRRGEGVEVRGICASRRSMSRKAWSVNPLPTCPAYTSPVSSYTPSRSVIQYPDVAETVEVKPRQHLPAFDVRLT
jgi:hypothetical protein